MTCCHRRRIVAHKQHARLQLLPPAPFRCNVTCSEMCCERARTRGFTTINVHVDCSVRAHAWLCFYGGDKDNRSHVCVCCDEGCPAMNEEKRRWAAAEEGQRWRRQQRARASLRSSCAPQEGSSMRMVATDGQFQSCVPPEPACVSSCKQHKPSCANSLALLSEVSPRFHQQAHSGLMTSTSCPHERSVATPAHKRMRREQPQNNATQHHQHFSHRQQQRGRVTCSLHSRQPGAREAGAQWTHDLYLLRK